MKRLLLCLILLACGNPLPTATPDEVLHPYVAEYDLVRGNRVEAQVTVTLEQTTPGQWRMHSRTRATGGVAALTGISLEETSDFIGAETGLECRRYHYLQSGLRKREREISCGTGEAGIVSRDHRGEYRFPAQPGVVDRQIASLALAQQLAAGKRGELAVPVVDRERLEPQHYRSTGEERLALPDGPAHTLKVERVHDSGERRTTTWFGIEQGWVPVKIVHSGKSGGYELRLRSMRR